MYVRYSDEDKIKEGLLFYKEIKWTDKAQDLSNIIEVI
jgi:hypothetical protein